MTRVLVTMRSIRDPAMGELRDSLSRDWSDYFDDIDVTPVPVTNGVAEPGDLLRKLAPDALLLTNGEDVGAHPPRDRTERALIDVATSMDLPVLGVCRGHQYLNDYYGGDLITLDTYMSETTSHAGTEHEIRTHESTVSALFPEVSTVNSYHDMAVPRDGIAPPLEPFATADDGAVVEGLYHTDDRVLSIQWHPERPMSEPGPTDALVTKFLGGELSW